MEDKTKEQLIEEIESLHKQVAELEQDVTERKRAEEALQASETEKKGILDAMSDIVLFQDTNLFIRWGNEVAGQSVGKTPQELVGCRCYELWHDRSEPCEGCPVLKALETGSHAKSIMMTPDRRWWEVRGEPIRDRDRKIVGAIEIACDITERKRAEQALRKERDKAQKYLDVANTIIVVIDSDEKVTLINRKGCEVLGYKEEEILGKNWYDNFLPERIRDKVKAVSAKLMTGKIRPVEYFENPVLTKSGEERIIAWHNTVLRDDERNITGTLSSGEDITERKKAEEQLEHSFVDLAETVSRAMSSRDPYTASHQQRVALLARLIGEKMGLDNDTIQGLYIGGLLHDIGKISTPESILSKPGKLADEEWALIHAHAKQGYEILKDTNLPWPVSDMALHHHERLDGSGYPHGISGDKLSLEVRILGVCDVVEAMSSHRPYRPARSKEEVLQEIKGGRGTKYDAKVVDVMLQIIENGEFEFGWSSEAREATKAPAL